MRYEDLDDVAQREANADRVDPTTRLLRDVFVMALRDTLRSMALRPPAGPTALGCEAQALERKREQERLLVEEIRNLDRNMARLSEAVDKARRAKHDLGPWWE